MSKETSNGEPQLLETEVLTPFKDSKENPADLASKYLRIHKSGLGLTVEGEMTIEEFGPLLDFKLREQQGVQFQVGDLLLHGDKTYKSKLVLYLGATGRSAKTLESYMYVARAFPIGKRNEKLTWTAHQELARLANSDKPTAKEQLEKIMDKAVDKQLSKTEIRDQVDKALPKKEKKPGAKKRGPKTKAAKKAAKEPKVTARDPVAEEQALLNHFKKNILKELNSAINNTIKAFDEVPCKAEKLTLHEVILKGSNADKKGVTNAAPDMATIHRLAKYFQAIIDRTGYGQ